MARGDHGNERHEAAQRRDRVLQLRDEGLTFREIGEELGVTEQRAWQIHRKALRERPVLAESAQRDHERKQAQLASLDEQRRELDMEREAVMEVLTRKGHTVVTNSGVVIENVQDDPTTLAAVAHLVRLDELKLKIDDHEAKLLGLYSEKKLNLSGGVTYQVVGVDMEKLT